ncbi:MAG: lysine--tRNA ligase, partial [Nitrospirae bacterium]|nr:lysine--tRNA ligase [Candidatus Troglogloeales bacterium]
YDRFRKVPINIPKNFTEFIGRPLSKVPDPNNCHPSYATHYQTEFEISLLELGIQIEFLDQTKLYESGLYCDAILEAVSKRHAIYDILQKFRTQAGSSEERDGYYPITLYCERCGKDTTQVSATSSESHIAYHCTECQHDGEQDLKHARNIKLPWKVDWAMRWRHEKVVFEPGGKDHATAGGSFEVSSEIAKDIFHYRPPIFQPYEFIGLKGLTGKMSGSSGVLLTPGDALKVYQPEVLLSVFAKMPPNKAFDLVLDDGIYRVYDEFDRANSKTPLEREIALSRIPGRSPHAVAFKQLASFCGIVQGNDAALELIFTRMGTPYKSELFEERLQKAENWLSEYAPEQRLVLREKRDDDYFNALTPAQKNWIVSLYDFLATKQCTLDEATHEVYEIPKKDQPPDTDLIPHQRDFFKIIYHLLFGKEKGPRLGTFFAAVPKEQYLSLLEFRTG